MKGMGKSLNVNVGRQHKFTLFMLGTSNYGGLTLGWTERKLNQKLSDQFLILARPLYKFSITSARPSGVA